MSRKRSADKGFTLVELLVAMVIASILITVALSTVVGSQQAVVVTKQQSDLNEEARQALNRMARDVRQANEIITAVKPDGSPTSSSVMAVRFTADFNGDTCIGITPPVGVTPAPVCAAYDSSNPEDITYCFQAGVTQLYIIDNQSSPPVTPVAAGDAVCDGGQPLLAGNVQDFSVEYRSRLYRYDANADGVTSWQELDAVPGLGNQDGLLNVEVDEIDSLALNITMRLDGREQVYRTQVNLRNRST